MPPSAAFGGAPFGADSETFEQDPTSIPLAGTRMREIVSKAHGKALGIERLCEKIWPSLVLVIGAHPPCAEDVDFEAASWSSNDPRIVPVVGGRARPEVDAAITNQVLSVGMEVAEMTPGVDGAALAGILAHILLGNMFVLGDVPGLCLYSQAAQN